MNPRLEQMAQYVYDRLPPHNRTPTHVAWICFHSDMEAYRWRGEPITHTQYCRGVALPYPCGSDERVWARFVRARTPWPLRLLGDCIAAGYTLHAILRRWIP